MTSPITVLTDLAISVYQVAAQGLQAQQPMLMTMASGDPVIDGLARFTVLKLVKNDEIERACHIVSSDPDLQPLISSEDGLFSIVTHDSGGSSGQINMQTVIGSLFTSAAMRMYLLRLQPSESAFIGLVLENYEELKRAARGEQIRVYQITGFSGLKLRENDRVATPWGTLYPAPNFGPSWIHRPFAPSTGAILASPQLVRVTLSKYPGSDSGPADQEWLKQIDRMAQLLPLAFALATIDDNLCAPLITFQTVIHPFGSGGFGWSGGVGYSLPVDSAEPTPAELVQVEVWSRRLDQHYVENLQIAGRRIISAIAQRQDKTDALIDAVTAWESMVGTGTEISFRVTAALAKLLEPDPRKRLDRRKEFGRIYDLRSRVIHGDPADTSEIISAASQAIHIGLKALSAFYAKPEDWLTAKSKDRADRLILEE